MQGLVQRQEQPEVNLLEGEVLLSFNQGKRTLQRSLEAHLPMIPFPNTGRAYCRDAPPMQPQGKSVSGTRLVIIQAEKEREYCKATRSIAAGG